ncbi:hypothetical protein JQ557_30100 [Bradyrhizobium sp. U87765 SZCCT0131]|uniref:hypothetical protein n=1 Tax=unclassified Bradyrhizobium TaxID=2631580 RepID=UPI001BADC413|nr:MULTISPECIES: hypothetical protein [unclassified Bradyrhizobium]MBR1222287.1 hypothetical protein [Bradyrhizobium sp. U87765 SZCCT0131]MBR1264229.1 hypothetical protein [Bradyrhizobium sp. U87765 SZCCT0134]MBR1307988.1 hypothetical protein [Bradyrhizobium sp. U87765 SZCCT0110]MBR1320479.1 hypothetical protein [Bradyrhizobium sp. U87765 SZCCT0109]MBR1348408.1 hypothetical protein [Bradyrhizobium sp. U87765 SZCCT0048]
MTGIDNAHRQPPRTAASNDPIAGALAPVLTSAIAIIRESGGLVRHLAGFGVALLVSPTPPSRSAADRPRTAAPARDNVIPFPIAPAVRPRSTHHGLTS